MTLYEEVAEIREEIGKAALNIPYPRKASGLVGHAMEQSAVTQVYYAMVEILDKHTFAAVKQYCHEECIQVPTYDVFNPLLSGCCSFEDWRRDNERLARCVSNGNS
jgi:hypothetical protein